MILRVMCCVALVVAAGGLVGCEGGASPSRLGRMEDWRLPPRPSQDRTQELAAVRAEMAATRIAAAKKEAELMELRALVAQLRQDNGEIRQALFEAKRTEEAIRVELAAVKLERNEASQKAESHQEDGQHVAALQEAVATLKHEVGALKQALVTARVSIPAQAGIREQKSGEGLVSRRALTSREVSPSTSEEPSNRIVPALHIVRAEAEGKRGSRVTIQPGDTLWGLARQHRTTIAALRAANGLNGEQLLAGQTIRIP